MPLDQLPWPEWYEVVTDASFRQGDVLQNLWTFWIDEDVPQFDETQGPTAGSLPKAAFGRGNWIVASASCDLQNRAQSILLCHLLSATPANVLAENDKVMLDRLELMKRGLVPSRFLLPAAPTADPPLSASVVAFTSSIVLPLSYVRDRVRERARLRLRSPFRESFGNWLGGRISSVGIEDGDRLPPFRRAPTSEKHVLEADDAQAEAG